MADLRALRRKLEAEIEELQKKLSALEMVEQAHRELGGRGPNPRLLDRRAGSVTNACRKIVTADPSRMWKAADVFELVRRDGVPNATRENVGTAMRRLAHAGILEVVSGSRRVGFTYRVKT